MSEQTVKAVWAYFRMFAGVVLIALCVYLIVTGGEGSTIDRLLLFIIGLIQAGQGGGTIYSMRSSNGNGG